MTETTVSSTGVVHQSNPTNAGPPAGAPASQALGLDVAGIKASLQADVASGHLTQAEAAADWARYSTDPLPALSPDDAQKLQAGEIDQAFPGGRADEFGRNGQWPKFADVAARHAAATGQQPTEAEIFAADQRVRGWLETAKIPAEIGGFLATEIDKIDAHWNDPKMTDAGRELFIREQRAQLERMHGAELPAKIKLVDQLIAEVEKVVPGVVAFLDATGARHSALIQTQLILHAGRRLARVQK